MFLEYSIGLEDSSTKYKTDREDKIADVT